MARTIAPLIEPLGILWLGLLVWIAIQLFRRKFRAALLPAILVAFLSIFGGTDLAPTLLASLEQPYTGLNLAELAPADAVLMLGGTTEASRDDLFGMHLNESVDRVVTAVELVRRQKAPVLVLGGGGQEVGREIVGEGELLERWLRAWGLPNAPVYRLGVNPDTYWECVRARELIAKKGWQRVLLVSSAYHLRRGEAIMQKLGVPATGVGCDFIGTASLSQRQGLPAIPRLDRFHMLGLYLHELAGLWYYRLRGWA